MSLLTRCCGCFRGSQRRTDSISGSDSSVSVDGKRIQMELHSAGSTKSTGSSSGEVGETSAAATQIGVTEEELSSLFRPSEINLKLEVAIGKWENAIQEYQDLENEYVDAENAEVVAVLTNLRNRPYPFLKSENKDVCLLARKRVEVFKFQHSLGLSGGNPVDRRGSATGGVMPSTGSSSPVLSPLANRIVPRTAEARGRAQSEHPSSAPTLNSKDRVSRATLVDVSKRMSITYAERMHDIDPTLEISPSVFSGATGSSGASGIGSDSITHQIPTVKKLVKTKIRPKWPDYLLDVQYDVFKVNSVGKRLRRTLKMTEFHLLNIKEDGNNISKVHPYTELAEIWLENPTTLRIKQKDGLVLTYLSPIASHLVQEISTRVKTRLALDRTAFSGPVGQTGDLPASVENLIAAISDQNSIEGSSTMMSFAEELGGMALQYNKSQSPNRARTESSADANGAGSGSGSGSGSQQQTKPLLFAIKENTGEFRVRKEVLSVVFDPQTAEGSTRKDFVDTFSTRAKTLPDVRRFIDDLHRHILSTRGLELGSLMKTAGNDLDSSQHSVTSEKSGGGTEAPAGRPVYRRQLSWENPFSMLMSSSSSHSQQSSRAAAAAIASAASATAAQSSSSSTDMVDRKGRVMDLSELSSSDLAVLSFIAFSVVEEAVCVPLKEQIDLHLRAICSRTEEEDFLAKMEIMASRSQEDWGIPPEIVSPLGWHNASFELSAMEHHQIPSMQLLALSRCIKSIYSEFKLVVLPRLSAKGEERFIGADDLVPIFLYVMCHSSLKRPIMFKNRLWGLCHPTQLMGESGYYLTVLEAAIEYITDADVNATDREVNTSRGRGSSVGRAMDGERSKSRDSGGDAGEDGGEKADDEAAQGTIYSAAPDTPSSADLSPIMHTQSSVSWTTDSSDLHAVGRTFSSDAIYTDQVRARSSSNSFSSFASYLSSPRQEGRNVGVKREKGTMRQVFE